MPESNERGYTSSRSQLRKKSEDQFLDATCLGEGKSVFRCKSRFVGPSFVTDISSKSILASGQVTNAEETQIVCFLTCSHHPKAMTFCGEAMGVVMPPMLLENAIPSSKAFAKGSPDGS